MYTIPAHSSLISQVKFEPQEGYFLVTASYDLTAKIWSARDFKPVKMLSGHEEKVASLDISGVKFPRPSYANFFHYYFLFHQPKVCMDYIHKKYGWIFWVYDCIMA